MMCFFGCPSRIRWVELSISHHFPQRNHDEIALRHARMWNLQVGFVDNEVVVEQDVDIDRPVVIDKRSRGSIDGGFLATAKFAFYLLGEVEHFTR